MQRGPQSLRKYKLTHAYPGMTPLFTEFALTE